LYFKHFMSDGRLSLDYVSRLRKAMAYSNFMLCPYLDLLKGQPQTQKDFIKSALKGMPMMLIKKVGALFIGTYEQKEVAKRYLRQLRYKLFSYKTYKKNVDIVKSWQS